MEAVLNGVPDDLFEGLPEDDQQAIWAAIGQKVTIVGERDGKSEVEFCDKDGAVHTIWVDPSYLTTCHPL